MLARFRVLLPFELHVREGDQLAPQASGHEGCEVTIHPPFRSQVNREALAPNSGVPVSRIIDAMEPAVPPPVSPIVRINDAPGVMVDMIQLTFKRAEFVRTTDSEDPSWHACFALANSLVQRLRVVTRAPALAVLEPMATCSRIDYVNDDGSELQPAEGLIRSRKRGSFRIGAVVITSGVWDSVRTLPPTFECGRSLELLLDAIALLPRVGPCLVLAASALETRVEQVLEIAAGTSTLPPGLWQWINDRGDYRKEPSAAEQADVLMRVLTGASLKDSGDLWEGFKNLREARNAFAHEGVARIGDDVVDAQRANALMARCWSILEWLDARVPPDRRLVQPVQVANVEMMQMMIVPPQAAAAQAAQAGEGQRELQ